MTALLLGHYVSAGVHPYVDRDNNADRWLSCNDAMVMEVRGADVCKVRQCQAYVLFYERRVR